MKEDPQYPQENDYLAEGGGTGGGAHAVHERRQRVSPLRGLGLVFFIVLAVIVVAAAVLWSVGYLAVSGPRVAALWIVVIAICAATGIGIMYSLLRRNV